MVQYTAARRSGRRIMRMDVLHKCGVYRTAACTIGFEPYRSELRPPRLQPQVFSHKDTMMPLAGTVDGRGSALPYCLVSTYASNHGTKPSASLFVESHLECMFLSVAKAAPCTAHATAVPPPRVPRAQPAPSPGQIATSAPDRPASDPVRAPHHDDDLASLAASPVTRTLGSCCGGGRPARRGSEGADALGPERP